MGTEEPLSLREDLKQLHQVETTSRDKLSWSTARQRQYCSPLIFTKASFMKKLLLYFRYYRLRRPAYLRKHERTDDYRLRRPAYLRKHERTDELVIANKEIEKRADALILANKELAFQNEEKDKRADELVLANKEKENRAD
ncbi:MAG: hypothetical protein ACI96M_003562, partial [Candidatus Azotimanducaceae bacterium]